MGGFYLEIYEPLYIFIFLISLGLIYLILFFYVIYKFKFNSIGLILIFLSISSYVLIGKYMIDYGNFADERASTLFGIGFLELIILSYPYNFLVLSLLLGKKGKHMPQKR